MRKFRIAPALATAFLLAGCGGGMPGAPPGTQPSKTANKPVKLTATPGSLSFSSVGTSASQLFTATAQSNGTLSAASSNTSVATVSPPSAATSDGQVKSASFTVTPVSNGDATITVSNKQGDSAIVAVTVAAPPGPLTVNTSSVTICPSSGTDACNSNSEIVQLMQPNFSGAFVESNDCDPHVATLTFDPANGPSASFIIRGQSEVGGCRAIFKGGAGASVGVAIIVAAPGLNINLQSTH